MEMEEDGLQKYQFDEEDEEMEGKGLMVRYSGEGVPETAMGDKNEPGSSYNLSSGWYLETSEFVFYCDIPLFFCYLLTCIFHYL